MADHCAENRVLRRCAVLVISNLEYGGAQRQVVELANNIDRARFDIHVCSLSKYIPLGSQLRDSDRRLHVIRKNWKFDITVVPRLAWLLRALKADIVHGYLFDAEIAARLAGRLAGTRAIIGSERNTDHYLKRRQLVVYRLTRGCVDLTIANSNAGAAYNGRMLGYDASHYRVVHNGVNTAAFVPQDGKAIRRGLGIGEDERVVGFFASFKQQKNHSLFFGCLKLVLEAIYLTIQEAIGGTRALLQYLWHRRLACVSTAGTAVPQWVLLECLK